MAETTTRAGISHVGFISIHVNDLDRAIEFYVNQLGFAKTTDAQMGPGARWVELTPPGGKTRVTLISRGNPAWMPELIGKGIAAPFEVAGDFEKVCADLEARGVRFNKAPKQEFYGWWAEILDADDNILGLHAGA